MLYNIIYITQNRTILLIETENGILGGDFYFFQSDPVIRSIISVFLPRNQIRNSNPDPFFIIKSQIMMIDSTHLKLPLSLWLPVGAIKIVQDERVWGGNKWILPAYYLIFIN